MIAKTKMLVYFIQRLDKLFIYSQLQKCKCNNVTLFNKKGINLLWQTFVCSTKLNQKKWHWRNAAGITITTEGT